MHVLCRKLAALFCESYKRLRLDCVTTIGKRVVKDPMTTVSAWTIGILKKYGADQEILDGNDKTCLDIAKDNNLSELHELLEIPVDPTFVAMGTEISQTQVTVGSSCTASKVKASWNVSLPLSAHWIWGFWTCACWNK